MAGACYIAPDLMAVLRQIRLALKDYCGHCGRPVCMHTNKYNGPETGGIGYELTIGRRRLSASNWSMQSGTIKSTAGRRICIQLCAAGVRFHCRQSVSKTTRYVSICRENGPNDDHCHEYRAFAPPGGHLPPVSDHSANLTLKVRTHFPCSRPVLRPVSQCMYLRAAREYGP